MIYDVSQWVGIDKYFRQHHISPVLIVLAGSIPMRMASVQSDIDIFGYHTEESSDTILIRMEKPQLKDIGIDISPFDRYQITSESLEHAEKCISSSEIRSLHCIENLLCHPRLFEDTKNDDYQALLAMANGMVPDGLINLYIRYADINMNMIQEHTQVHEKFVLGFIRFALAAINLQETGKIEINIRTLMHTYGIDFDWGKHFYKEKRTYPIEHWYEIIQKATEKLEQCKRNI